MQKLLLTLVGKKVEIQVFSGLTYDGVVMEVAYEYTLIKTIHNQNVYIYTGAMMTVCVK